MMWFNKILIKKLDLEEMHRTQSVIGDKNMIRLNKIDNNLLQH